MIERSLLSFKLYHDLALDMDFASFAHGYGNTGYGLFKRVEQKLERFLHKNPPTHRKLLNFEFWINGELSKKGHHY